MGGFLQDALDGLLGGVSGSTTKSSGKTASRCSDSVLETAAKSMIRSVGTGIYYFIFNEIMIKYEILFHYIFIKILER